MRSISLLRPLAACALAAGVAASATACTGNSGTHTPGSTGASGPAATGAAGSGGAGSGGAHASGGSYSDSSAVVSALKNVGHSACAPVAGSATPALSAPGLRSATSCSIGSGGAVTVTVFDNHADAQLYASALTSSQASGLLIGGTKQRAVLGQNWVVLVPDDTAYAQQVSAALGGTLVGPSSSAGS